jgi:hypothetical protein
LDNLYRHCDIFAPHASANMSRQQTFGNPGEEIPMKVRREASTLIKKAKAMDTASTPFGAVGGS